MSKDQLVAQLDKETKEYEQFILAVGQEKAARVARIQLLKELIATEEQDESDSRQVSDLAS